jgi:hypothetical protein
MRSSYRLGLALGALVLFAASTATAQTPTQPPPGSGTPNQPPPGWGTTPPPQPPPAPPPAAPAPPPPSALPAPAPAPYKEGEPSEQGDEGRIRVGLNVNGGIGTGDKLYGGTIGATFRIGYQIDHLMAVYGQVSPFVFFGGYKDATNLKVSAIGGFQFTPMFSLTPIDLLEIAAGPSLDKLAGGTPSVSTGDNSVTAGATVYSSFYIGLHGRVALHLGGKPNVKTGRRFGFTIAGDLHPIFAEGGTLTFVTLGLGVDWY